MKLLLTSAGLSNISLKNALKDMVGDKEIKIAFIPTASNIEEGDKDWLIKDYVECTKVGSLDIVDISAVSKEVWLPRLKSANTIFIGGGHTYYLMDWINKSGLSKELPELLKTRVYVGISAGSMVVCPKLTLSSSDLTQHSKYSKDMSGLEYVKFYLKPHYNSSFFPQSIDEYIKLDAEKLDNDTYAIDDQSGIKVVNGKMEIISEGKWKKF